MGWLISIFWVVVFVVVTVGTVCLLFSSRTGDMDADIAARADEQHARWMGGDDNAVYGDYLPDPMFLKSERVNVKLSNDGTPLLTRAAVMVKRAEYIERHWGKVRASIDAPVSVEMLAIQRFLDHCSRREGMSYCQFIDYVRSSSVYALEVGDGSRPLTTVTASANRESAATRRQHSV